MSEHLKDSSNQKDPLCVVLETLVAPAFREFPDHNEDGPSPIQIEKTDGQWDLCAFLDGGQLVCVTPMAIDRERTLLSFNLEAGIFLDQIGDRILMVGGILEGSLFHVRAGIPAAYRGKLIVGFDLVVRADDALLVRQRTLQLLSIGTELEWFFELRMPERLRLAEMVHLEIAWEELPHGDLGDFLDKQLEMPPFERPAFVLLRIAQGLGRWEDVLRLLKEHPDKFPENDFAYLEAMALRELGRWRPAMKAAERAGLKDGRYAHEPWLNPTYLHSLIEAGCDIEALRLLGPPEDDDPVFYDWLRGLALFRAGDTRGAKAAFDRYFDTCPGDFIGLAASEEWLEECGAD